MERDQLRKLPRPFHMPWGSGSITEEVSIAREHWDPAVQLLTYEDRSETLRFCYYQGSRFGRGPMLAEAGDLEDLAAAAVDVAPRISEAFERMAAASQRGLTG